MRITKTSAISGKSHTREIPITLDQYNAWGSHSVQAAFPHLSASDREFLLTGATDEEWAALEEIE